MPMHYASPEDAASLHTLPSIETFEHECSCPSRWGGTSKEPTQAHTDECNMPSGWYWWTCQPGCLPDSDGSGPFATEAEALEDAHRYDDFDPTYPGE